jgi:hypothetical protein
VLGVHRSGSSAVTGLLRANGVALGPDLLGRSVFNRRGHFEDRFVVTTNKRLLLHFGGSWDDPPDMPRDWLHEPFVQRLLARARAYHRAVVAPHARFAFKDPRTCLLVPFWQRAFGPMTYVVTLRDPKAVLESLQRRQQEWTRPRRLPWRVSRYLYQSLTGAREPLHRPVSGWAEGLWDRYYESVARAVTGEPVVVVVYEDLLDDPAAQAPRVLAELDVPAPWNWEQVLDASLSHQTRPRVPDAVRKLGEALAAPPSKQRFGHGVADG